MGEQYEFVVFHDPPESIVQAMGETHFSLYAPASQSLRRLPAARPVAVHPYLLACSHAVSFLVTGLSKLPALGVMAPQIKKSDDERRAEIQFGFMPYNRKMFGGARHVGSDRGVGGSNLMCEPGRLIIPSSMAP